MDMQQAIEDVVNAIRDEGKYPRHHKVVYYKHRTEWPKLWKALDELLKAYDEGSSR